MSQVARVSEANVVNLHALHSSEHLRDEGLVAAREGLGSRIAVEHGQQRLLVRHRRLDLEAAISKERLQGGDDNADVALGMRGANNRLNARWGMVTSDSFGACSRGTPILDRPCT